MKKNSLFYLTLSLLLFSADSLPVSSQDSPTLLVGQNTTNTLSNPLGALNRSPVSSRELPPNALASNLSPKKPAVCNNLNSQVDINNCAAALYRQADRRLNEVYKQVISRLNRRERETFTNEQLAWIRRRDAACKDQGRIDATSSAYSGARDACLASETDKRTAELEKYLPTQNIIYKFDFRANTRDYLFFASRNTDGSVALYISQPNLQQVRPLNIFEINNRFTRKIIQASRKSPSFVITFAEGNGWSSPLIAYGLDLSNPANPTVKSLSILQEKGVLKEGGPVLNGNLYRTHTFEGRAGQSVTVTLLSQRAFDHYAAIIAPNGKKIAESYGTQNKEPSKDRTSEFSITLIQGGSYQVIVSGKDRNSRGAYTLSVNSNK